MVEISIKPFKFSSNFIRATKLLKALWELGAIQGTYQINEVLKVYDNRQEINIDIWNYLISTFDYFAIQINRSSWGHDFIWTLFGRDDDRWNYFRLLNSIRTFEVDY
ncbi:hypothetical protein DBR11_13765 [Pedobacter sp. HMWF019]|nr:hypothetical protein DBR11_13765 [Pedobacter sp. HMWF019]